MIDDVSNLDTAVVSAQMTAERFMLVAAKCLIHDEHRQIVWDGERLTVECCVTPRTKQSRDNMVIATQSARMPICRFCKREADPGRNPNPGWRCSSCQRWQDECFGPCSSCGVTTRHYMPEKPPLQYF